VNDQVSILRDALELLGDVLGAWGERKAKANIKDIRRGYINRHAWNIHEIGSDVLILAEAGSLGSIYLLSRPVLESLFKLAAAVFEKTFAGEKVVSEVEEERDKVRNWLKSADASWSPTLNKIIKGLDEMAEDLRKRYGVSTQRKWKVYEVAKVGNLEAEYVRDYFAGSKHVHVMLSALVAREDQIYVPEALYRLTASVAHASALVNKALMDLEKCVAPGVFEKAAQILELAKEKHDVASMKLTSLYKGLG
jgi:hypothetical protein